MTGAQVYWTGAIAAFTLIIMILEDDGEDWTVGTVLFALLLSALSWLTAIAMAWEIHDHPLRKR